MGNSAATFFLASGAIAILSAIGLAFAPVTFFYLFGGSGQEIPAGTFWKILVMTTISLTAAGLLIANFIVVRQTRRRNVSFPWLLLRNLCGMALILRLTNDVIQAYGSPRILLLPVFWAIDLTIPIGLMAVFAAAQAMKPVASVQEQG